MAAQYTCCDEPSDEASVTEYNGGSFSDLSFDIDDLNVQPDFSLEEDTLPSQPKPPAHATGIQETSSTPDMDDSSKIAKGGLSPRPRPLLRKGGSVVLSRRRLRTHAPLRGNTSVEATTSGEPRQKQGPSKDSQQVPTRREPIRKLSPPRTKERRDEPPVKTEQLQNQSSTDMVDNSKKAKEATVGHRRRQCTRPLLNSRSYTLQSRSSKTMTPTAEQYSELKKTSRQDARPPSFASSGTNSEPLVRLKRSASAA
jgi:hypothetical protein